MLRTWVRGRRGVAVAVASAAAVGLGGAATVAFGGASGPATYVAVGAAGGSDAPDRGAAPTGKVELVPLDQDSPGPAGSGARAEGADGSGRGGGEGEGEETGKGKGGNTGTDKGGSTERAGGRAGGAGGKGSGGGSSAAGSPGAGAGSSGSPGRSGGGGGGGGAGGGAPSAPGQGPGTPAGGGSTAPPAPAALKVGDPVLKDAGHRWCQDVTLALHNSGGSAVRSGTVTFGTHIIGSLGVDWATVESTEELPVPIGPGEKKEKTWTVCVDSWRVPLGMHVETRDVSVRWK
ncbi:hypothetical protein [Streptomyces sp. NPDC088785]|uniref:hypothetical protein n=1 Tax=Streptomyces sp. NPDC088785 TaxID=3365897 RepID=UPI003824B72D